MASWLSTVANSALPFSTTRGWIRTVRAWGSHSPAAPGLRGSVSARRTLAAANTVSSSAIARRSAPKLGGLAIRARSSATESVG